MRLVAKYGTGLKMDLLQQQNEMSAMHRISVMPNTQLIAQQAKRLETRTLVEDFYRANDPSKLGQVDAFVEWIEANGPKAFNDLLTRKYGKCLEVKETTATAVNDGRPAPPKPPAMPARPGPAASVSEPAAPAPPPPAAEEEEPRPDPKLVAKLRRFYKFHDDSDMDLADVALWGQAVGMERLNEKLSQLYGGSLETLDADIAAAAAPPPPPPPPEEPEPEPAPAAPEPPKATLTKPTPPVKPTPPSAVAAALPKITILQKPTPPTPPVAAMQRQNSGSTLGTAAAAPKVATPKPVPPTMPASLAAVAPPTPKGGAAPPQRKRRPSEGACDKYTLDLVRGERRPVHARD